MMSVAVLAAVLAQAYVEVDTVGDRGSPFSPRGS
jgi:hypothetical protein